MPYLRWWKDGSTGPVEPKKSKWPPLEERLWPKVDKAGPNGCWLWTGPQDPQGYGRISKDGEKRLAHRVVYELVVGAIPDGLTLDHLCRVRHCVNPDHLEPVTHAENVRRGSWAQRTHCPSGHEYTPENTRVGLKRGRPSRTCIACARRHSANQYQKRKLRRVS